MCKLYSIYMEAHSLFISSLKLLILEGSNRKSSTSKASAKARRSKKGAVVDDQKMEEFKETMQDTMIETQDEMWEEITQNDDNSKDEDNFNIDEISLEREGKTFELFKQKYMDEACKYFSKPVLKEFDLHLQYVYR